MTTETGYAKEDKYETEKIKTKTKLNYAIILDKRATVNYGRIFWMYAY